MLHHLNRFLSCAALLGMAAALPATTISTGVQDPVVSGGVAPGSPSDYYFFGGPQPTNLNDYTITFSPNDYLYSGPLLPCSPCYTQAIAPGGTTPFYTGIAYDGSSGDAHTAVIATFSPDAAGDFNVFIMDGNTDTEAVGNSTVGLGVNWNTPVTTATIYGQTGYNEFTEYTVTGALPTDVFQLYATTSVDNYPSLGGVTFESTSQSPTPEPATIGEALAGFVALFAIARRRRS